MQTRSLTILNRRPTLPECGKIKIGRKGNARQSQGGKAFQPPQKLDHFIVTTMERDSDGNFLPDVPLMQSIAERTGQDANALRKIPVRLLYNDPGLNMASRYAAYDGMTVWCSGDGETANRRQADGTYQSRKCPCENLEPDYRGQQKCKINGNLAVLIEGAAVRGVWRFRTTSFNSVDGLTGALLFMHGITGGQLANVPLWLTVNPKQVQDPTGKPQTIYVVGLEYQGDSNQLRQEAYTVALQASQAGLRIADIENEAKRLLEAPEDTVFEGEDAGDVAQEYYPQEAARVVEQSPPAPAPVPAEAQPENVGIAGEKTSKALSTIRTVADARNEALLRQLGREEMSRKPHPRKQIIEAIKERLAGLEAPAPAETPAHPPMPPVTEPWQQAIEKEMAYRLDRIAAWDQGVCAKWREHEPEWRAMEGFNEEWFMAAKRHYWAVAAEHGYPQEFPI